MAGKGPSSKAPAPVAKPATKGVPKPAAQKEAAPVAARAAPKPVAVPPVPASAKAVATSAPLPPKPPAAKPTGVEPVETPIVAPVPVVASPTASDVTPEPENIPELPVPELPVPELPIIVPAPVVASAAAVIKKEVIAMESTIKSAAEKVQAQAKTLFSDVNDRTKSALEKGSKTFEEINEFSKGNVEALVESSKIAAKGAEDIAKYTTDYVKGSVEKANSAVKQFAAVKSPTDLFKLQSEHTKEAIDNIMAETAKFTENYLKLLGEIAQPISTRVALAAEKIKIAA